MIRLLVVGLGRQAQRYLRIAERSDEATVVATVDVEASRACGPPLYPTIDEALGGGGIDAAVVASPTGLHFEHTYRLLEAGIPTLVEKPFTGTEADAAKLAELSLSSRTPLFVGHVERFNPAVQLVASMLRAGEIGTPLTCTFRRVGLPPRSGHEFGVVNDLAVHDVDVFAHLVGAPRLVSATGWPRTPAPEAAFLLLASGDVSGLVEVNWRTPVRLRQFSITSDTCVVSVSYTNQRVEVTEAGDGANPMDFLAFQSHYSTARRVLFEPPATEPLFEQFRAFCAALRGEETPVLATADDGRRAVGIAESATRLIAE